MPRIKKKGQAGAAKNYITRNQAIRKLQISLPDFRKLCIWKGIYPREPRNKKKVSKSVTSSTTFYYTKDIQYLLHEPLLAKFRDQKVLEKKIARALGRGDVSDAKRLDGNAARPETTGKPRYTLDHVVRERYPTFVDALRDLDDCLSMLFLFANLPSTSSVPAKMIARCERLCLEFQHYLIASKSLKKSFLSIKGIYYQASIQGEDILWLVPYRFNQRIVGDVDFRIMGTFVEFYMTLLGFVNFRLYTGIGLKYPPKFDKSKDEMSGELSAFTIEGQNILMDKSAGGTAAAAANNDEDTAMHEVDPKVQAAVNKVIKTIEDGSSSSSSTTITAATKDTAVEEENKEEEEADSTVIDKFEPVVAGGDVLAQPEHTNGDVANLFANCTFYLSRETPRQPLEFILRSFGCKRIGWDQILGEGAYTTNELDPSITHQIVDRPPIQVSSSTSANEQQEEDNQTAQKLDPNRRVPGRIYVQPQWVWDSMNDGELKRIDLYAPGEQLPPHLSPFVQKVQGAYDPTMPLEDQETEMEALDDADAQGRISDDDDEGDEVKMIEGGEGMDIAGTDDDEDDEDQDQDDKLSAFDDEASDDDNEPETNNEDSAAQRRAELEAELTGAAVKPSKAVTAQQKARDATRKELTKQAQQEAEDVERAKGMLSKKKRKLYEKMIYSNNKKSEEDKKLRAKRRKFEKQQQ